MLVLNPLNRQFTYSPHEVLLCTIFLALGCRKYSIWFAALQILCHSLKRVKPAMDLHATMSTLRGQHCGSSDSFLNCLCVQWGGRLSILKTRIVNLKWQMEIFFFYQFMYREHQTSVTLCCMNLLVLAVAKLAFLLIC